MNMPRYLAPWILLVGLALFGHSLRAEDVVRDGDIAVSRAEFQAVLDSLPPGLLEKAANDNGERFELITQLVTARKLARESRRMTPDDDGYWALQFQLIEARRKARFEQLLDAAVDIPEEDLLALARERYATLKDRVARIPETRMSSHILLASPPGRDRTALRERAQSLLEELRAGASFSEYVAKYSDDPGSQRRGGSLGRWVSFGQRDITPPYSEALFEIEKVGDFSEVTDSPFGLHIIRLDGIRPSRYRSFDEVKDEIVSAIVKEQRQLATREVLARYLLTDDAFIDGQAMEELFAPYK